MKLKVVNTGSKGNAYILDNGRSQLLIECGVRFSEIKKALNFNLSNVVGCLVTHEHQDHCKAHKEIIETGISLYSSKGTFDALEIQDHNRNELKALKKYRIGEFTIMPFDIQHDVKEPFGFLIHHNDCGLILFATDTYNIKYNFPKVEIALIEANYDQRVIDDKKENDTLHFGDYRVIKSHMSIQNCCRYLKSIDTSKLRRVITIHISDRNGDANFFKNEVENSIGLPCEVANKGDVYEIRNKVNF
jgi:phosphoribosyl 1,2-cyclic phosphodiesterase